MIDKKLKKILDTLKINPKESYKDVIYKLVDEYIERHKLNDFADHAQRAKMKELWDNEEDEAWEI
ncbi:hypothetical protein J7J90_00790 [Candidatus Micrarchaeota archaeon]|nr:hypothetical protein [Candidatus Micrarchaeota archaeon]